VVVHIYNPSTQEDKAGGLQIQDKPVYIERPCLKRGKKTKEREKKRKRKIE
jgi:hypothetical protein